MAHTWSEVQPAGNANKSWQTSAMSSDGSKIIAGVYDGRLYLGTEDPPHDIAVDPLTATAGITEPTLTQTHELKANPLTAQATLTGMSSTFATCVVSGAGDEWVNGTYAEAATDYFVFGQNILGKRSDGKWHIYDAYDSTIQLYITTDTPATPDLGTWVKGQYGIDPPPTVVAGTPLPANPDILVSGAGSDLVNGTYEHTTFEDGKPIYTKGSERYKVANYGLWRILAPYTHPEWGDVNYPYYQEKPSESGSPATPDLVAEWEIWTMEGDPTTGVNPPPTVTEYTEPTLSQTHKLTATALTATAGISEPTLSIAHNLRPEPLTSTADISEPTLSQTHKLTADPLVAVAGITEPTLTQAVVVDVAPLTATADITEPTLTQTHIINVEPLSASAGLTEPTLTQTHIINVEPLGMVANLTDIDFAQTHVIDIEPLWAQIELSDLTLAQYIRTPTPDCRRLTIHAEDRTLTIPREDRTLKIKCCD